MKETEANPFANTHENDHHEGGSAPPRSIDPDRTVFAVAVTYTVTAKLYVLAHDHNEAVVLAESVDLDDLIGFDESQIWIDADTRLEFDDIVPALQGTAEPVSLADYDPKDHPDWHPELRK